jgi:hypothetical protein
VERMAVAVAGTPTHFFIAADGTVLGPATEEVHLPFVESEAHPAGMKAGERLSGPRAALAAVAALPESLRPEVRRAGFDAHGVLTMTLRSGARVIYGDADRAEEKGQALKALLRWADRHDVTPATLDVRAPARPALLPVGAPTEPTIITSP